MGATLPYGDVWIQHNCYYSGGHHQIWNYGLCLSFPFFFPHFKHAPQRLNYTARTFVYVEVNYCIPMFASFPRLFS